MMRRQGKPRRWYMAVSGLFGTATLIAPVSWAQQATDYPSRPVRLVVPFPASSSTDLIARTIGQKLSERWRQPVVIENKPGAAGNIGSQAVAAAPADGYTLLMSTVANAISAIYFPKLGYDFVKDLVPVSLVATAPLVIVVRRESSASTVQDLIRNAKATPGKLTYGSGGNGTATHFTGELLNQRADIRLVHVPYKGATAAQADLMGGQIDVLLDNLAGIIPNIQSGRLKALAVTSAQRSVLLPNVPTVSEAGLPGFDAGGWQGVNAPAGTPKPVIEKLSRDINAVLRLPEVRERIEKSGAVPAGTAPEQFGQFIRNEMKKWQQVEKTAGVQDG